VGKDLQSGTGIGIPTHSRVCLEMNTHTGTLDYFINDKHIKDRVVSVPKDVYFRVNCFYYFLLFCLVIYFIFAATSHIIGDNSNSGIYVGTNFKSSTSIAIPTHTRVCLELNTHTRRLDYYYFMNNKYIKDRVVNVPKDVYFGV
jgi:hypothetical protein